MTASEKNEDESENDFDRDDEFRNSAMKRASPIRDDSETMRTDRENYISEFENVRKPAAPKILSTTRSERAPERDNDPLKSIINTDNYYDGKRDTAPDFMPENQSPLYREYKADNHNYELE